MDEKHKFYDLPPTNFGQDFLENFKLTTEMKFRVLRKDHIEILLFNGSIQKISINDSMIFVFKLERKKIFSENNNESFNLSLENKSDQNEKKKFKYITIIYKFK